jgi:UDP-N-acetylglucosamine/UDP-N-acetylgalactosamine diphosphorylase
LLHLPLVLSGPRFANPPEHQRSVTGRIDQLRERYAASGQDHVLRFWDSLDDGGRERLARQAERIDLGEIARIFAAARNLAAPGVRRLEPVPVDRLPEHGGSAAARGTARRRGEDLLRAGRVGVVVVAGGQGTRLGFDGPKGTFSIGPVSERSLFELHGQRLRRARARYGAAIPWYVMTSPATDSETRGFFAGHGHFGLPRGDVMFFCQATVPALDPEGRLILEAPDRIAESPNGHGGAFTALADSGALADMERRGVTLISYFQVDNPLVPPADPTFLGLHDGAGAEFSCKVIRKRDPMEKLGVLARVDGRVGIVEYTEIDDEHRHARGPDGELVYWAGNPAIHTLDVRFARAVAEAADECLPYHASAKKIPTVDAAGRPVQPEAPNGYKLERFLFDALPAARRVELVEVDRELEYAPVKNAEGGDSPATARAALSDLARRWLEASGVRVPPDVSIELDHAHIDCEEDVKERGIRSVEATGIRVASGGS